MDDLIQEAVRSKNWSWDIGMRVRDAKGRLGVISGFKSLNTRSHVDVSWDDGKVIHMLKADLTPVIAAPTTRALILEMARRAWCSPSLFAGTADGWYVSVPDLKSPSLWRVIEGATEEEAVLRAFLAAPIGLLPDDLEPRDA